jgi:hypothetical protein
VNVEMAVLDGELAVPDHVLERLGRAPLSPPADTRRPAPPQAKSSSAYMTTTSSVDKSAGARERPKK